MAMLSHRLRRVLVAVPYCFQRPFSLSRASNLTSVLSLLPRSVAKQSTELGRSPARLFSTTQYEFDPYTGEDSFTPDNEGCDFNHWLITMDFPKENPPSREEMISIFEQTCAKGLGISLEEAKRKIYAICTTSYQGFQATMTIGEVEKFRELPGVQYIIPDSYADVENKVYGGDKYENGVVTSGPIPVPTKEGFDSLEKEDTPGQEQAHGSQAPSDEGLTSGQVQDQGSQTPPDQKIFEKGQGTLALRHGGGQGSRMLLSGQGVGRGHGSQMLTPRQGQGRGLGNQMPSFQGSFKRDQGALALGQGNVQGSQKPSVQGTFKQGQGTPTLGQGQAKGSQKPSFQRGHNQGQGTPIHGQGQGQGQGSQIPTYQSGYSQGQGAHMPPCQGSPQENYNQMGRGNYMLQSGGNYGSAQETGSPGYGHGYSGQRQGHGGQLLSPYQGSYNQGHGTPMPGQGQIPSYQMGYSQDLRAPVPPYQGNYNQGTPENYGQWEFVNYNQGPPHGNFLQRPQQNYNQGGQWSFSSHNGGHFGPLHFGQGYPGHVHGQGNYMPQYQLSYNQGQGAPFPGQWRCQGCGMLSYQGSYNQGQGTLNPVQWQGQGYAVPSYQASYSHSQGATAPPSQGNYNHTSYGQGTSAHFNQGIPVNYSQMGQGNYNSQSGRNYGPVREATRNPGFGQGQSPTFQQEEQRNVADEWSNNNHIEPTETGKVIS